MSKSADLIKSIAKKPVGEKPTYGTDPRDPWSAKAGITEDAILNKFLKSRGINPLYVSKDQKVAHSKMGEFKKWKQDHMFEQTTEPSPTLKRLKELKKSQKHQTPIVKGVAEAVDKKDTVTFDIPLLIRVLELAREDIKSDMDLHRVVERLINMRDQGMLTMDDYDTIANIKENHIAIAMGRMLDDEGSMVLDQLEQLERAIGMIRAYVGKDYKKQLPAWVQSKVTLGTDYIDTVGNYLSSKNEDIKEDSMYGDRADKLLARSHSAFRSGDKETSNRAHKLFLKARDKHWSNPVNREKSINAQMSGATADYADREKKYGPGKVRDCVELDGDVISENDPWKQKHFGPTKVIKQKYHVKTDTKSYNVIADTEKHAHELVSQHAPGSKIVSVAHKGRMMEEVEQIDEISKELANRYMHSAFSDRKKTDDKMLALQNKQDTGDKFFRSHKKIGKLLAKSSKRTAGIDRALNRLKEETLLEKNKPTQPEKWARAKAAAKSKFAVYPSAYANAWASKKYKSMGGGWRSTSEEVEQIDEISDTTLTSYKEKAKKSADTLHAQGQYKKSANRWLNVMKATGKQIDKMQKENTLDPKAATEAPCDCANCSGDVAPKDKNKKLIQMSKSARIIKSIYNRKNMKEEIYDHEKEDKSVATYGKKPKVTDIEKKIDATGGKAQAAAIMTGGTTLTGTPRDTVEIDPMMKLKPGLIGQTKK